MRKLILIGAVLVITVAALGAAASYAYAQAPTPGNPAPWSGGGGRGMRGGRGAGMMGGGMMGGQAAGQMGIMQPYMRNAMAKALKMDVKDLQAALDSGKTMWAVAAEKGIPQDQFFTLMQTARQEALKQMVADGVITQTQADAMLQRGPGGRGAGRGGQGGCPMMNGGQANPQPAPTTPGGNS